MTELHSICFDNDKLSVVIILKDGKMSEYDATVEAVELIRRG